MRGPIRVRETTDATFARDVLEASGPALVEFREVARMEGMPTPRTDEALDAFIAGAVAAGE
jgi:hypothetical protein